MLFWQLKFPKEKWFLKLFWSNILGRVRHENARGRINSRKEDWENIPTDGQKSWWEIVFRRIYRGKIIPILKIQFYCQSVPGCKEWSIHCETAPVWSCQLNYTKRIKQYRLPIMFLVPLREYQYCNIGTLLSWSIKIKTLLLFLFLFTTHKISLKYPLQKSFSLCQLL